MALCSPKAIAGFCVLGHLISPEDLAVIYPGNLCTRQGEHPSCSIGKPAEMGLLVSAALPNIQTGFITRRKLIPALDIWPWAAWRPIKEKAGTHHPKKGERNARLATYIYHFPLALEDGPKEKTSKAATASVELVQLIDQGHPVRLLWYGRIIRKE